MINLHINGIQSYFETENEINIELDSFDNFIKTNEYLHEIGYVLKGVVSDLKYEYIGEKMLFLKIEKSPLFDQKVVMPDYSNSMVNIASSISKYYNRNTNYPSIKSIDNLLNENKPKHVCFVILDGMAPYIMSKALKKDAFLNRYMVQPISAVYPPTTACAIPCSASGKLSIETGWIGWENHFKKLNLDLVMFMGVNYLTGAYTGINVRKDLLPYDNYFKDFDTYVSDLEPIFLPNGFDSFPKLLNKLVEITNTKEKSFTYAYWDEPDATLHKFGTDSEKSFKEIERLNNDFESIIDKLPKDTMIIITADHGHIDVERIKLYEFKEIMDMLKRNPSNESRCLCFEVKEEYKNVFSNTFNKYFKTIYDLYSRDEFLAKGFLGDITKYKKHPIIDEFLGDFVAVAKSNYYFEYVKPVNEFVFKSHHAGLTKLEMEVPLIIYNK